MSDPKPPPSTAAALAAPPEARPEPRRLVIEPGDMYCGRYRIVELLGRGGMGEVWAAIDVELDRPVAIKVIKRKLARIPEYHRRFQREAKAVAKLNHPNIVRLYDSGRALDGRLYMVMEQVEGMTLRETIAQSLRLDLVTAIYFATKIADALAVAHAAGIWHRDVKPENVIVTDDGRLWVLDFGVAKDIQRGTGPREGGDGDGEPRESVLMGTLRYMAPELILNRPADHRGDLYALGVVLYEMLTGRYPYGTAVEKGTETRLQAAHVEDVPLAMDLLVPELTESIIRVTLRLLAKEPSDRYESAEAVVVALNEAMRESLPPLHPIARSVVKDRAEKARKRKFDRTRMESRLALEAEDAVLTSAPANDAGPSDEEPEEAPSGKGGTEPLSIAARAGTEPLSIAARAGTVSSAAEAAPVEAVRPTVELIAGAAPPPMRAPFPLAPPSRAREQEGRPTVELIAGAAPPPMRVPFPLAPPSRRAPVAAARPAPREQPYDTRARRASRAVPAEDRRIRVIAGLLLAAAFASVVVLLVLEVRSGLRRDAPAPPITVTATATDAEGTTAPSVEPPAAVSTAAASAAASTSARAPLKPKPPKQGGAARPAPKKGQDVLLGHDKPLFRSAPRDPSGRSY